MIRSIATKRLFDIIVSGLGILISFPITVSIALWIRLTMGSPVFFIQTRPGYKEKLFSLLKFRTMSNEKDSRGNLLPSSERLTKLGRFLRKTSLDEIPQLFNVLVGDLSLVGPRPLLTEYLDEYSGEQRRRHDVKPGITGWAQVKGRNNLSWEERFKMDVWYVDNWSVLLDIKILIMTIFKVIKREDTTPTDAEIMPRFKSSVRNEKKL